MTPESGRRHPNIRYGNLPWPNHLVTADQATHRSIGNRDQELLAGNRGMGNDPDQRLGKRDRKLERLLFSHVPLYVLVKFWRLAKQHGHGNIDRRRSLEIVRHGQVVRIPGNTHHRKGTSLSLADFLEPGEILFRDCKYIALLGFIAPDFQGGHTRFCTRNPAQLKVATDAAILDQFRERVG